MIATRYRLTTGLKTMGFGAAGRRRTTGSCTSATTTSMDFFDSSSKEPDDQGSVAPNEPSECIEDLRE